MRKLIIAAAILSATSMSALAVQNQGGNGGANGGNYLAAPGPVLGAGDPAALAIGIGYGIYWLRKRRRRA
jgi:hypothetical protein